MLNSFWQLKSTQSVEMIIISLSVRQCPAHKNFAEQTSLQVDIIFTTIDTVELAEEIITDSLLRQCFYVYKGPINFV